MAQKTASTTRFKPVNYLNSPLRLANFLLIFAITGVFFLIYTNASVMPGLYGSAQTAEVKRINAERSARGIGTLKNVECLNTIAEKWSVYMGTTGDFRHSTDLLQKELAACGQPSAWIGIGENVGTSNIATDVGTTSKNLFYDGFMQSTPHREALLASQFTRVGVGVYATNNTIYVTHVFGGCRDVCPSNWDKLATMPTDPVNVVSSKWYDWQDISGVVGKSAIPDGSGPSVSSMGTNRLDVFIRSAYANLQQKYFDGTNWSAWITPANSTEPIVSTPASISISDARQDVFARGTNNALKHKVNAYGTWTAWEDLGGNFTESPAVTSMAAGRMDVFVKSGAGTLVHRWLVNGKWASEDLGGVLASSPTATSMADGRMDIFARGTSGTLKHKWFVSGKWSGWEDLGGVMTSAPSATSMTTNRMDIFARSAGGTLQHKLFTSGKWSGWEDLGGSIVDAPAATSRGNGKLDVFARGTSGELLYKKYAP